jgi:hypothetical protein
MTLNLLNRRQDKKLLLWIHIWGFENEFLKGKVVLTSENLCFQIDMQYLISVT